MTLTSVDDYVEFCTFLRRLTGIDLSQYKRPQMERRLRTFYANKGVHSLTDAIERLASDPQHLEELLDRITINVSQLWRNPEQWEIIQNRLLPELAEHGQLRAWSAGCSYGAEAYTLATLCHVVASRQARHDQRHRHRQAHDRAGSAWVFQRGRRAHGSREAAERRLRPRGRRLAGQAEPALDDALRSG